MWWRQRIKTNVFCLVLVTFILSLDYTDARDFDRRVANNEPKYYRRIQNDKRIPSHRIMQPKKKITTVRRIQNDRKFLTAKGMQNRRTYYSTDRRILNDKKAPPARIILNDRAVPTPRKILNNRRAVTARRIQNGRNVPTARRIQDKRIFVYEKVTQNERVKNNDEKLQNYRSMRNNRRVPIISDRVTTYDKILPNFRRGPIISRLQYDKGIQTDKREQLETMQPDGMMLSDKIVRNDKITQSRRFMPNDKIIPPDRIIDNDKRMKINKILESDRIQQNLLRRKIDSIMQNDKVEQNDRELSNNRRLYKERIQNERRILNERRMQNARRIQNVRKVKDNKRILEKNDQNNINARRMRYDRRMWVATPAVLRNFMDNSTAPPDMPDDFNSSELGPEKEKQPVSSTRPTGWAGFWMSLMMIFEGMAGLTPAGTESQKVRACLHIATTYMGALKDLRKYFEVRYFYENNLHYEVGYMTNEIISKYQRMLEIYHIAQINWYKHQGREFASSVYMLYLYTNVLEMGTVIGHLCNMLNELEDKFRYVPKTGFSDYHIPKKAKFYVNGTEQFEKSISDYEKRLAAEKKRRAKERRKMRKKNLFAGYKPTPPDRRPNPSSWPMNYGWSIEYAW